jgi:hypothetical protein
VPCWSAGFATMQLKFNHGYAAGSKKTFYYFAKKSVKHTLWQLYFQEKMTDTTFIVKHC